jgi:AAA15 family ATPase/GTPase
LGMAKVVEAEFYSFSYPTISETLRRIVFFMAILETNQNAVLVLDEPETNTFPFYTTYVAERIALDESNQFFLTTHNPYVLGSIVGKTPIKDLAVFVTVMEDFRTRLKSVSAEGLSQLLDYGPDAFLNLDKLVDR